MSAVAPRYASSVLNSLPRNDSGLAPWRRTIDDARVQQALEQSATPRDASMTLAVMTKCLAHAYHTGRLTALVRYRLLSSSLARLTVSTVGHRQTTSSRQSPAVYVWRVIRVNAATEDFALFALADSIALWVDRFGSARHPCTPRESLVVLQCTPEADCSSFRSKGESQTSKRKRRHALSSG